MLEIPAIDKPTHPAGRVLGLEAKTDLHCDPLRPDILRMDDRNQVFDPDRPGVIAACRSGFGGQASTLQFGPHVVADLEFTSPTDLLPSESWTSPRLTDT